MQLYEQFFEYYAKVNGKAKAVSKKGKSPESEVWDSDTFAEYCEGVFGVQLPQVEDGEEGSGGGGSRSLSRSGSS